MYCDSIILANGREISGILSFNIVNDTTLNFEVSMSKQNISNLITILSNEEFLAKIEYYGGDGTLHDTAINYRKLLNVSWIRDEENSEDNKYLITLEKKESSVADLKNEIEILSDAIAELAEIIAGGM